MNQNALKRGCIITLIIYLISAISFYLIGDEQLHYRYIKSNMLSPSSVCGEINVFTIDTEDWFYTNYEDGLFQNDGNICSTVEKNTDTYLNILEQYGSKATFFILGFVAKEHPELVKHIAAMGHEIASHEYALIYKQTQNEFREDEMCA